MRSTIKLIINRFCQLLVLPMAITCWLETRLTSHSEAIFSFWTHTVSIFPGLPGVFLRRAFYSLTLEKCSLNAYIGFGTIFAHRSTVVEDNVYTGIYCSIGSAHLGKNSLIGSHSSLLSGNTQHTRNEVNGVWMAFSAENIKRIDVAENVWIGEGAIILANIGKGSLVAAGAVVNTNVKANIVVAGNPARFVKSFEPIAPALTPEQKLSEAVLTSQPEV
ncbi:acyltransferase [Paraglaciecola chathamensis]|uniref:2,3,4,5-tetrahydropyridine-2,6-dicarboxylate N-acetyltransferase n=1 Tax=Paraglaciecola chathamensis S18K6 TaxID=1127672 RepID=A0AAV3UWZ8_9ALTE|nr:acyltransferase [Paraglaciecola chathamensis]GAC09662.1 2,3,4,5-tetrahydropyridine-2,6-dicarboxylate N-acetyltransferase [Paraglaciecola chathamensis S18K6]